MRNEKTFSLDELSWERRTARSLRKIRMSQPDLMYLIRYVLNAIVLQHTQPSVTELLFEAVGALRLMATYELY